MFEPEFWLPLGLIVTAVSLVVCILCPDRDADLDGDAEIMFGFGMTSLLIWLLCTAFSG